MKKYVAIAFLISALVSLPFVAVGADDLKVGVVDLQRCMEESREGQKIKQKLIGKKAALQKTIDEKQNALLELKEELEKQSMMLSMDAREDKAKEFERQSREFKYYYEDLSEQLRKAELEARQQVLKDLEKVVSKIGQEGGFSLVFERRTSGLMYMDQTIDITDVVVKGYDAVKP